MIIRRAIIGAALLALISSGVASAADKIRAGKAIDDNWVYMPLDIGVETGIFAKYGLDVEISNLPGGAKLQQALLSGSIDVGLGGSQAMALTVKGSPAIAVAAFAGPPRNFAVIVATDSPIRTVPDLKGKSMGFASNGSLPDWLMQRLSIVEGWGPSGIKGIATGGAQASNAALISHQIDSIITTRETGLSLEAKKQGRIITGLEKYAPHLITQVIFTRQPLLQDNPDLVSRFLKAFYASVVFIKTNKEKTVEMSSRILHMDPAVISQTYDYELSMISDDGQFDPAGMQVLEDSFVELGILTEKPTDKQVIDTRFLPVKP